MAIRDILLPEFDQEMVNTPKMLALSWRIMLFASGPIAIDV